MTQQIQNALPALHVQDLDETYSLITGDKSVLKSIHEFLKVEEPGAYFDKMVQRGFKSPWRYFSKITQDGLVVYTGHLAMLEKFGVQAKNFKTDKYNIKDIQKYFNDIKQTLPFTPYDYQVKMFAESILNQRQICLACTSSGKSVTIAMILDFYRTHGLKGLLVVPNINLLTQFRADIESYNLKELLEDTEILGAGNVPTFEKSVLITTWQSMVKHTDKLDKYQYVLEDEVHRESSEVAGDIARCAKNMKIRLGFTGTLPEDPVAKMTLLGIFGTPKRYISARELIDRGLGTPIKINSIFFEYSKEFKNLIRSTKVYSKQLQMIKEYPPRNNFITDLAIRLQAKNENTLILFQHTQHGKDLFLGIMQKLYPDVQVEPKDITGKKSFEFQTKYHVYFLNGEDDAKTREDTRKILETDNKAILVANYALMSTGVNIKQLFNLIMASPLKAYTTITQAIGRGMRLHINKNVFRVFDLIDDIGFRHHTGLFVRSYNHRKTSSYIPEDYELIEMDFKL